MFRETETAMSIVGREREINNIGIYLQNIRKSKKGKFRLLRHLSLVTSVSNQREFCLQTQKPAFSETQEEVAFPLLLRRP